MFDDLRESTMRACAEMVESVIGGLGYELTRARLEAESGLAWGLRSGSAQVFVYLNASEEGDDYLQVVAPVMRPPEGVAGLFEHLLDLNASELTGAAFGRRGLDVVVTADRSTSGLDSVEVEDMIRRVAEYADYYDDILTVEYGGTRFSDLPRAAG